MLGNPLFFGLFLVSLVLALSVHECSHALIADRLGDPTGRLMGRITLNPIAHLDPMGAILILFSSIAGIGFGWGKPVPVNYQNLKPSPKTGMALTSVAGPVSNLLLAGLCALLLRFLVEAETGLDVNAAQLIANFLYVAVLVNISLAIFNLIPIPPLDGFHVLLGLLPDRASYALARIEQYGPALLLILVFFGSQYLSTFTRFFTVPLMQAFGLS